MRKLGAATAAAGRAPRLRVLGACASATILLIALACASASVASAAQSATSGAPAIETLARSVPSVVAHGLARQVGSHPESAELTLNVDLQVREGAELQELIGAASTLGSLDYGGYLTQAQYLARFAPTDAEVQAVEGWLRGEGLDVTGATRDNAMIHVSTSTALAETAFGVAIEDYALAGHQFYANDRAPSVPSDLHVQSVGGLTNYALPQPAHLCSGHFCGYYGTDFRAAYDISGNGEHESIGFTLWGEELSQHEYTEYAKLTSTKTLTVGASGPNGLEFIQVGGPSEINSDGEIGLDTEVAHAVAPGIHETYWLGANNQWTTLETTLNEAAESSIDIISSSWDSTGYDSCEVPAGLESVLEHGAATGKTFFFSTGDAGAEEGCHAPSSSPYAVAVGGTDLSTGSKGEWKSETAIKDDGGCTNSEPRPEWQTGIGSPLEYPLGSCSGRATPDVSADSCYSAEETFPSGECYAETFDEGLDYESGGTSLAAPLWAAGSAIWNKDNVTAKRPPLGFVAPALYRLANSADYAKDFHDITTGTNDFAATAGWDEATGWGSPNFKNLEVTASQPVAETGGASEVTQTTAVLNGVVSPEGVKVSGCKFEYGTTTKYGSSASCAQLPGAGSIPVEVAAKLKGLKPGLTYYYRISATNAAGTVKGGNEDFSTASPAAPQVTTGHASDVSDTTATLEAYVDPRLGEVTKCDFEYGTTAKYGASAACPGKVGSGTGPVIVQAGIKSLKAGTTYHFRISATNDAGTSKGADEEFTTG